MEEIQNIPDYLQRAIHFLYENSWIFRESNTEFVEKEVLDNIPLTWIEAIQRLTNDEFNKLPTGLIREDFPEDLKRILESAKQLKGTNSRSNEQMSDIEETRIKGMSPKKSHEITRLANSIKEQCGDVDLLIDLGCGLGYLSEYLFLHFGYRLLGLECDEKRVESAIERQLKYYPLSQNNVKYVTHFITESSMDFIKDQIGLRFPKELIETVAIIGLHACGDLTITALRLASNEPMVTGLVIMPCCYHRRTIIDGSTEFRSFPLSETLKTISKERQGDKNGSSGPEGTAMDTCKASSLELHRPFLRLACQQSVKHWLTMTEAEHRIHGNGMFTRSLVGAVASCNSKEGYTIQRISKGKRAKDRPQNFEEICNEFVLFIEGEKVPWTPSHLERFNYYSEKYPSGGFLSEILTGLQTTIQEICENVVLLDQVQYIDELGREGVQCRIDKITNDKLSPRCFAIILNKGMVT